MLNAYSLNCYGPSLEPVYFLVFFTDNFTVSIQKLYQIKAKQNLYVKLHLIVHLEVILPINL